MKKMFAKLGMPSLLSLAFLLGGLLFATTSAQSQTLVGTMSPAATQLKINANWKSVDDAKTALSSEIAYMDQTLSAGSTGYPTQMKMKMTIYVKILADLETGLEVPVAAITNYNQFAPAAGVDGLPAVPGMNSGDWTNIYNDMLGVLTQ